MPEFEMCSLEMARTPSRRISGGAGAWLAGGSLKVNQNYGSPDPGLCCSSSSTWPSVTAHVVCLPCSHERKGREPPIQTTKLPCR